LSISQPAFKNARVASSTLCTILTISISSLLTACGGSSGGGGGSTPPPPAATTYTVGGTLSGLASGNSITLTDNGSDNLKLTANGAFTFATPLDSAAAYNLTISATTPTAQPCTSIYGEGTVNSANVTILNVFCGLPGGPGTYSTTGPLATARISHTTTLLNNGTVLAAGGVGPGLSYLASSELYSPAAGGWTGTGALTQARAYHTATLLPNGNVLVAGGEYVSSTNAGTALTSAELYNPSTGSWTATGSLNTARWGHTATLLTNGKILVAGGVAQSGDYLTSAELYDPSTGTWTATGSLNTARFDHTQTLLPNGKVLVAGGDSTVITSSSETYASLNSAELYDPSAGTWAATGSLVAARALHTATLLPDGNVLACGGTNDPTVASAELFNPSTGAWTSTGSLATERSLHTAVLLPSGNVLISGGENGGSDLASSELYNPGTGNWSSAGSLMQARSGHNATLLIDGKVLASGGAISLAALASTSELYF